MNFAMLFWAQNIKKKITTKEEHTNQVTLVIFIFRVSPVDTELTQDTVVFSNLAVNS